MFCPGGCGTLSICVVFDSKCHNICKKIKLAGLGNSHTTTMRLKEIQFSMIWERV